MRDPKSTASMGSPAVAIIGMAGRFPGAKNIGEYWRNLREGVESITFFAKREIDTSVAGDSAIENPDFVKAGAILDAVDLFDSPFFGFSPREAETMDPQQRLLLECSWAALEDAGYCAETYQGSIGVYAGSLLSGYLRNLYLNRNIMESVDPMQIGLGNFADFLTTVISYKLNLRGPSYAVQTACSTSLVAVHVACQALLNGECDMALAGGVAVRLPQRSGYMYEEGGILSPDGHCRAFDAKAQGTILGNGVGMVVLKRLDDALEDRDSVYAVVRGSAINNDGAAKIGFTAPSVDAQAEVIVEALSTAGIDPRTIGYVEAHGTGTSLGDPIEIEALTRAFRTGTDEKGFCAIGSVKTNIGHADAAAGVAGLIKTALALKHRQIPASLHFVEPNPKIDFQNGPFYVNTELREWKQSDTPRRAGVSSLGIGGTNAHVILEEAPEYERSRQSRPCHLLLLSGKTASALERTTYNLRRHLEQYSDINLADVAYTLQVGRQPFLYRRMLVCRDAADAIDTLTRRPADRVLSAITDKENPPVAFVFPGQASQHPGMSAELYESEPLFRREVDRCVTFLRPLLGFDLRDLIFTRNEEVEGGRSVIQTGVAQPALFVVEYALARLWMSLGVHPKAMLGHSIGEYTAACLAGVFTLEEALSLVAARGLIMQNHLPGAMLTVAMAEDDLRSIIDDHNLSIAAVNAPSLCVVSGTIEEVKRFKELLSKMQIDCRVLHTSHAFHSAMMDPLVQPFLEEVKKIALKPPQLPFISNVTGTWIRDGEATDPGYWAGHIRRTVRFGDGMKELLNNPDLVFLEVGPGQSLTALAREQAGGESDRVMLASMRHQQDTGSDVEQFTRTAGRLWLSGVPVDWSRFNAEFDARRVSLPTYPFEPYRYWVEPDMGSETINAHTTAISKRPDMNEWFYVHSWKRAPLASSIAAAGKSDTARTWLVFADAEGIGSRLIDMLECNGQQVIRVTAGEKEESGHSVDLNDLNSYERLIKELRVKGIIPDHIIHLWSLGEFSEENIDRPNEELIDRGYYSVLFLAQALAREKFIHPIRLSIVSNGMHEVNGSEAVRPEKALVLGPCKVIAQEQTNIQCRSIDIDLNDKKQPAELASRLFCEITSDSTDPAVAHRGSFRWVQSFEPFQPRLIETDSAVLRPRGVYLIVGGLGRFGLIIAEYLARSVQARLVLVERSGLPSKEQWDEWLSTHDNADPVSVKIRKVKALEALGAEVILIRGDLGDEMQINELILSTLQRFGAINGVIHAAGIYAQKSISELDRKESERILRAKVEGLIWLEKALRGVALDFCLLTSSLSPILGGLGYGAYSASNHFLDAFAVHARRKGAPWRSINWEGWHKQDSYLLQSQKTPQIGAELAQLLMTDEEVMKCFEQVLAMNTEPQIVIATGDLQSRIDRWIKLESIKRRDDAHRTGAAASAHEADLLSPFVAPRDAIEQMIVGIESSLLGIQQLDVYDNFFELGGNSLLAIQLISRLRDAFQLQIPLDTLFQRPTAASLAEFIRESQADTKDSEEIDRLLAEIEHLGDEEVKQRLNEYQSSGEAD